MSEATFETLDEEQREFRRLVEQASVLDSLQQHPGWQVFVDYLRKGAAEYERRLLAGHLESIEEYKLIAGRCEGIRQALDFPAAVQRAVDAAQRSLEALEQENVERYAAVNEPTLED